MRLAVAIVLVLAAGASLAGGCVASEATACGDVVCPIGRACGRPGHCVDEQVVSNCVGLAEGATCTVPEVGSGTCQSGLCLIGRCGDGAINAIDACDGAELGGKTCLDFGSTDPAGLGCTADCDYDTTGCVAYCGDGHRDEAEACDGEDFDGATCVDLGYYTGALLCNSDCTFNAGGCAGSCGDGDQNGFEQCDGLDFGTTTCASLGYLGDVAPMTCTSECAIFGGSCTCGGVLCTPNTQTCVANGPIHSCEPT